MLIGQTTHTFPLILLVLFPLPPNFHCWLTKPEEFIISETYGRAEWAKQGRAIFLSWPFWQWKTGIQSAYYYGYWSLGTVFSHMNCNPSYLEALCFFLPEIDNRFNLCCKDKFLIGILAWQKYSSHQKNWLVSSISISQILSGNNKPSFPCIHSLSIPTSALQEWGELEPFPAHTREEEVNTKVCDKAGR